MTFPSAIGEKMRSDLHDSDMLEVCERIVEWIERENSSNVRHLTYSNFFDFASDRDLVIRSIHYLAGGIGVLDVKFEFISEDEETYPIEISDVQQSQREGAYFHPNGDRIERDEFFRRLYPYFTPAQGVSGG